MSVTKCKAPDGEGWQVVVNGKPTALRIVKGDPPKFREEQVYEVCLARSDDMLRLFEAPGVGRCMGVLDTILEAIA